MNRLIRYIIATLLLTAATLPMAAQDYVFRYVSTAGAFENDGTSWATAKNNLQNAIDEVYELVRGTSKKGYVYVAGTDNDEGMVFVPTRRSTDDADGSVFNTSFRIYAGISVFGGFKGDETPTGEYSEETLWKLRIMENGHTYARVESDIDADNITETVRRWNFKYKTVLSGNHSTNTFSFRYDENRGIYNTSFPLSSYHVVWFGTNGKITPVSDEAGLSGHYLGLDRTAMLDGCTIEGGYASSSNLKNHEHTGYGGGVYMVRNALLRNCIIHHCAATMRGGAVYLDGGGEVDRCYIHTSQASGYGMQQGYGGGVCIDYDGAVKHSYIIQNAARIGAGLAICHVPDEYPEQSAKEQDASFVEAYASEADGQATPYDPFCSASIISNCTSNAEGGGVYLDEGGTLNHCTVVNNKCVGPDVIYYGRRHARTGGIYVRNRGTLYNTVAWGNLSPMNNDVQFASFKDAEAEAQNKLIAVYHCAFSKSDITDWSTATKESVTSLTNENTPETADAAGNFPIFSQPTFEVDSEGNFVTDENGQRILAVGIQHDDDGLVNPNLNASGQPYQRVYNWHPLAASKLRQKGVQVTDALQGISAEVLHAHIETDIVGRKFEAISSIGALAQSYRTKALTPPLSTSLEKGEEGTMIPTLLVDPNRKVYGPVNDMEYDANGNLVASAEHHAGYEDDNVTGDCWEHPIGNLGNAIRTLKRRQWTSGEKKDWFNLGGTKNDDGTFTGGTNYEHAQIIVKEGSITTAGPDCYLGNEARTASIRPVSNMRIYGSFPKSLTGTTVTGRNERLTPTKVSANVLNSTYMNNGAHVFALVNVHDVIIDGFRILDGNANLTAEHSYSDEPISYGGGLILNNTTVEQAERIDMTGNILRNSVIANCAAPEGSAIYVNGTNLKADGTRSRAELTVINCIMRNTTAGDMKGDIEWFTYKDGADYEDPVSGTDPTKNHMTGAAVVTANGNAHIWLRNCDIVNNCGYAMKGLNSNYPTDGDMFQIEIYNSIIFSNGQMVRPDRGNIQHPVTCKWSEQRSIIGNYIYIDWDAQKPPVPTDVKCFNYLTRDRQKDRTYATSDGTVSGTPLASYVDVYDNQMYATEHGAIDETPLMLHYPYFVNPSRNVGLSTVGDQPLYGGIVSYEPLNLNPLVNGACPDMETDTGAADLLPVNNTMAFDGSGNPEASDDNLYHHNCKAMAYDAALLPRTYGGAPDAGAIEGTRQPKGGTVIYVTPDGAGKRDGSSWSNAIQGNAVYQLGNVSGPELAAGDMLDATNGTDRVISSSGDASTAEAAVLTTDSKYCGGFGRVWFTDWKTGGTSTTTVTNTWITEKNVYVGGARNGEEEVLQDGSTPTETSETTVTSSGSNLTGFTAGYHYDPRYPYGEISGASRSFWRANPYHNGTDWNNGANYSDKDAFITACNNNGWINNSRQERYVGGLQYAVEKAAAYNALPENDANRIEDVDSIMVWVGNGKYTDYKGFVMRDKTTVTGSFPVSRGGTPGLSERQALMSDVISIPKSLPAQNFDAADYETILQISDTDPETDKETLNEEAVKYWDDDWSVLETTDTQTTREEERTIIHNYIWDDQGDDVSETYMLYPDMLKGTSSVFGDRHKTDKTAPSGGETVGGVTWSAGAKYVYQFFGSQSGGNNSWELVYANRTNNVDYNSFKFEGDRNVIDGSGNVIDVVKRGMELSGGMINMSVWQTMKNVPAGNYRIQADLAAFYRALNNGHDTGDKDTGITFYVIGSDGTVLTSQTIYCANLSTPYKLKRYTFDFTQPADGDLTIRIMAAPGTKATDPASGNLPALKNNPNRREVMMANVHLFKRGDYKYILGNTISNSNVIGSSDPVVTNLNTYTLQTHRTTLRKRVLTMPDVCVPTYGAGSVGDPVVTDRGKFVDNLCHTHRVTGDTKAKRTSWENANFVKEDPNYVEYSDVFWDGFTIRHGFIADEGMAHGGGAGVNLYEGAHLQNCIVIHNMSYSARVKGGGLFCDGATSTIEGCFVLNNTSTRGTNTVQDQIFAGGMFMYEGTCFNSLFAKNYSYGSAGGLGFCVGRFYNNTIAYNTCTLKEGGQYSGGAISLATASSPNLFVANTIIFGNNGIAIRDRNTGDGKVNPFLHCYVQSEVAQPNNATKKNVTNWTASNTGNYGIGNVFLNGVAPSADNTPFAADIASGSYDASNPGAKLANDFRLTSDLQDCINKGTEDFSGTLFTALRYKGKSENDIRNSFIYQSVEASVLPENDVAFARRVQDCQIDMGAYEFDGSKFIEPDLSEDGKAIFYVSQNGGGGLATASTPEDAACMVKLQKVLDAAGRWKYAVNFYERPTAADKDENGNWNMTNFDVSTLQRELTKAGVASDADHLADLKNRTVIVKLAGDYTRDGNGDYTPSNFNYSPTRSTNTDENVEENLLEFSLMVPHGVQVWGGYDNTFSDDARDVLGNPTRLSGYVQNSETDTKGEAFHVVTFVNDIFTPGEKLYKDDNSLQLTGQLNFLTDEKERAVLDGLFIQNGNANGTSDEDRNGAGAVVTAFAHVRNCIVHQNEAQGQGGGLYLEPHALVSGSIVKNNTAYEGGGIFVEEPDDGTVSSATYAHVISSTVIENVAQTVAGGLYFMTNLRANSSAFWKNTANDLSNVAGSFSSASTQVVENCPMNYCGVESRRIAGVNNIELPVAETEGVRWNHSDPHELMRWRMYNTTTTADSVYYYPIQLSSVLGRAGMTYAAYEEMRTIFPTLETADMSGLNRMEQTIENDYIRLADGTQILRVLKNNAFIEMGARVLNGSFELNVEYGHVMTRLFVTTTQQLPTEAALKLQQNTDTDDEAAMYRQMGSSFLNPFHRLGDALEYIIRVRKSDEAYTYTDDNGNTVETTIGDYYKDQRFEVFVCSGTFYPFRDAHGQQGEARANTFVMPEAVTIVGGVNHQTSGHSYCQLRTSGTLTVAGLTLNGAPTEEIRAGREHMDRNGNHVKEPWEMREQTILSGNAVNNTGSDNTNVYHVITCFADKDQIGKLPQRRSNDGSALAELQGAGTNYTRAELLDNLKAESRESRDKRTIFIDGVTITGGHANDIEDADKTDNYQKLTYFRGGGILVDGNWDNTFNSSVGLPEVLGVAKRDITMVTTNCIFMDNMAANGGAVYTNGTFYAFGCHFTKNYSQGPNTSSDQEYIPWSAGGAVANNYEIHLWNSLFDNNEAKRGLLPIINGTITNADERQGYGGVISCSETGLTRVTNCNFVRNKAVAFPALYNFIDNNLRSYSSMMTQSDVGTENYNMYYYGPGWHFAVNTIFWGNEATASTIAEATGLENLYYNMKYPGGWTERRKPNHVANFGPLLDVATLTFCAYEEGTGREGTVWYDNQNNAKSAQLIEKDGKDGLTRLYSGQFQDVLEESFGYYPDGHPETPFCKKVIISAENETYKYVPCAPTADGVQILDNGVLREPSEAEISSAIAYNYNLILNRENLDVGGPFFVQPSITAGESGYMETADWLVSRLNNTIDTGWGMLKQDVTQPSATSSLYETKLLDRNLNTVTDIDDDTQYTNLYGDGFYNIHSENIYRRFKDIGFPNLLPIGDEIYMEYVRNGSSETKNMRRISTHPKMGVQDVFIDMGVYEYQYVQLVTGGDQTDVIWVAETQDQSQICDGSTWAKATSDLQGAIETLLLSRNDHDKMIKLRAGTYSPTRITENNQKAFFINVPSRNAGVVLPAGVLDADVIFSVRSITLRGGYSNEATDDSSDGEITRDIERNPTVLQMVREKGNTDLQLEHLFIIEDAERKGTYVNYLSNDNKYFMEEVMPVIFDGLTFINPYGNTSQEGGGSALLYNTQYRTVSSDNSSNDYHKDNTQLLKPAPDNEGNPLPKLRIRNCVFKANSSNHGASAVKIEKGGGETLIVNSLFHSNGGDPLDAVNTRVINCTFALNGGHLKLKDETEVYHQSDPSQPAPSRSYESALHNSIIWQDDLNNNSATQWEVTAQDGTPFVMGTSERMTYNAYTLADRQPDGTTAEDGQHNFLLSKENEDVLLGPNFKNPYTVIPATFTTQQVIDVKCNERDFHIGPSAHILNRASVDVYKSNNSYDAEAATQELKEAENANGDKFQYWFHSVQHLEPLPLTDAHLRGTDSDYQERELAYKYRWLNNGIERGAYECTAVVDRVLYVMDGASGNEDGTTWEHAFNIDELQKAIDVASVYSLSSGTPQERAYVFVKASDSKVDALKLRDGVSVYGNISTLYSDMVVKNSTTDHYDDSEINAYITRMQAQRSGIATRNMTHNTVKGLLSENNSAYKSGFLLDGFWLTAGETDGTPINLVKDNTVLRNVVITGNTVTTAGKPVVTIGGNGLTHPALLYNTLVYDNTAGDGAAVVSVNEGGYVLNCTVVAPSNTAVDGTTAGTNVGNTIARDNSDTGPMFAPYLRTGANTYTPEEHHTSWRPYWYQLHEQSTQINAGTDDGTTPKNGGNTIAASFPASVNYDNDRDVLGNPRRLRGRVDNGCFETWRIEAGLSVEATNDTDAGFTTNYGGNSYPHPGSVVYVMDNANLLFATDGGTPRFTSPATIAPGYVLLRPGASVYGQGNTISFGYVAAEKAFTEGTQHHLMAFPFDVNTEGTVEVTGSASLTQTGMSSSITPYRYDAAARAAYNVEFHADNSPLWKTDLSAIERNSGQVTRTEGWLMSLDAPLTDNKTLRFTGWSMSGDENVYDEDGSSSKTVTLMQHDHHNIADKKYPRFTKLEDMGWNLRGQPWLVAEFATTAVDDSGNYDADGTAYRMSVPHIIYDNLSNANLNNTYGQFYTRGSWEDGCTLALGDGFFTQTAVIADGTGSGTETLTFKLPVFSGTTDATARNDEWLKLLLWTENDDGTDTWSDQLRLKVDTAASASMDYRLNSDGVKWMAFDKRAAQFWLEDAAGVPLSLSAHTPKNVLIPLGVRAAGNEVLTFSLSENTDAETIPSVWLIDDETGAVVDLKENAYQARMTTSEPAHRFALKIGGSSPKSEDAQGDRRYQVFVRNRMLHVKGTQAGDRILVYLPNGALYIKGEATDSHWQAPLRQSGVYVVRVNNVSYKFAVL